MELLLGLITGVVFGFLLQKARVLRFEKQVGFLRLVDMTIIKFMLSAIVVGMIGIWLLREGGCIALSPKATHVGAQIIGGLLFGAGWAVMGYCPGTSVGAIGEGRWHAIWAVAGMLCGAALFAEAYPFLKETVLTWGSLGKPTGPELLGVSPWIVIAVFAVIVVGLSAVFEKADL